LVGYENYGEKHGIIQRILRRDGKVVQIRPEVLQISGRDWRRLGLSYQAYQRLENPRKSNPTIKTLERIARAFGSELVVQL
jgi:hypothetical protein